MAQDESARNFWSHLIAFYFQQMARWRFNGIVSNNYRQMLDLKDESAILEFYHRFFEMRASTHLKYLLWAKETIDRAEKKLRSDLGEGSHTDMRVSTLLCVNLGFQVHNEFMHTKHHRRLQVKSNRNL